MSRMLLVFVVLLLSGLPVSAGDRPAPELFAGYLQGCWQQPPGDPWYQPQTSAKSRFTVVACFHGGVSGTATFSDIYRGSRNEDPYYLSGDVFTHSTTYELRDDKLWIVTPETTYPSGFRMAPEMTSSCDVKVVSSRGLALQGCVRWASKDEGAVRKTAKATNKVFARLPSIQSLAKSTPVSDVALRDALAGCWEVRDATSGNLATSACFEKTNKVTLTILLHSEGFEGEALYRVDHGRITLTTPHAYMEGGWSWDVPGTTVESGASLSCAVTMVSADELAFLNCSSRVPETWLFRFQHENRTGY